MTSAEDKQQLLETAAIIGDRDAVAGLLLENAPTGDSLHHAIVAGHVDIVSDLMMHGTSLYARDRLYNLRPLQLVAKHGRVSSAVDIVDILMKAGDCTELEATSPLYLAVLSGSFATVMALLRWGADPSSRCGQHGETPVHAAACRGHMHIVVALLGAKPGGVAFTDSHKRTPLHYACRQDRVATAGVLLDASADLEAHDMFNRTPLVVAVHSASASVVATLLERGADVNAVDGRGQTPLAHAAYLGGQVGAARMVDMVLRHGGDETLCNRDGKAPIDIVGGYVENANAVLVDFIGHDTDEVGRVRSLLEHAASDRSWRRMGYFVLLKALYVHSSDVRVAVTQAAAGEVWTAATAAWLLDAPKEIFREIVSYV